MKALRLIVVARPTTSGRGLRRDPSTRPGAAPASRRPRRVLQLLLRDRRQRVPGGDRRAVLGRRDAREAAEQPWHGGGQPGDGGRHVAERVVLGVLDPRAGGAVLAGGGGGGARGHNA